MTLIIKIKNGSKHTFWNVTEIIIKPQGALIKHSDRIDSMVQGFIDTIKRIE